MVGKLPFHGDFVARGVSAGDRKELDAWLSASVATAREEYGPRFADAFDAAPPWRFAWHDEQWTAGALVPSVDSSGRRFPLLVALTNLGEDQVAAAAMLCEEAAADAISRRLQADELADAVEAGDVTPTGSPAAEGWWNDDLGESGKLKGRRPAAILSRMLSALAAQ